MERSEKMFSFRNRGNYESSVYTVDFTIESSLKSHVFENTPPLYVFKDLALTVWYASRVPANEG